MVFEIGVNLRVTECLDKGDRNYMEDFSKCYFERVDGSIVFGFFGIFDGHGGPEAASFAKRNLVNEIKKISLFWSENDDEVLSAIKQGFFNTHQLMWAEREKWAKTVSGFDSTAGTTATVAIVRNRKLYIGHVGDSACVLGFSKITMARTDLWEPYCLTVEHKPANINERKRIEKCGGTLAKKSGVQRVVWNRPKISNFATNLLNRPHVSTAGNNALVEGDSLEYEQVPFLAVTRSLGDLWSYDHSQGVYHISPEPDVQCIPLDSMEHRCIILGSDGLWNVVSIRAAIEIIRICERETERRVFLDPNINSNFFYNPAASLVKYAISQWKRKQIRADNVSALVVMIDPPGPSMTKRREDRRKANFSALDIMNSLTCKSSTYENFAKVFAKEFLIECSRWRSANDAKDEMGDLNIKSIKDQNNTDIIADSLSLVSRKLSDKSQQNINTYQTSISNSLGPPSSKRYLHQLSNYTCHNAITSDLLYSKYCTSWNNNAKLWVFLTDYFRSLSLSTDTEIIKYLNSLDTTLSAQILVILPWIYSAKIAFKRQQILHAALNKVPLFSEIWLEIHSKYINPLEKTCSSIQFTNMDTILNILKQNIIALLKQHNYLVATQDKLSISNFKMEENNENNEVRFGKSKKISNNDLNNKKPKRRLNCTKNCENSSTERMRTNSLVSTNTPKSLSKKNNRSVHSDTKNRQNNIQKKSVSLQRSASEKIIENSLHKIVPNNLNNAVIASCLRRSQNVNHVGDSDITNRLSEINGNFRQNRRMLSVNTYNSHLQNDTSHAYNLSRNNYNQNNLIQPKISDLSNKSIDSASVTERCIKSQLIHKKQKQNLLKYIIKRTLSNYHD